MVVMKGTILFTHSLQQGDIQHSRSSAVTVSLFPAMMVRDSRKTGSPGASRNDVWCSRANDHDRMPALAGVQPFFKDLPYTENLFLLLQKDAVESVRHIKAITSRGIRKMHRNQIIVNHYGITGRRICAKG